MTNLPASPFMNSASSSDVDEAAASSAPPPPGAAANLSVSMAQPSGAMETEAAVFVRTAAASDIDCIPEIFRVANLLCEDARTFIPDYPSIYQAMLDPNAPRALETDPVWADEAPLFLKSQG